MKISRKKRWLLGLILLALPIVLAVILAEQQSWRPHFLMKDDVENLWFSPDDTLLVGKAGFELRVWDAQTVTLRKILPFKRQNWLPLTFSPDGRLFAVSIVQRNSALSVVQLWNVKDWTLNTTLSDPGYHDMAFARFDAAFSPDSKTFTFLRYNTISTWDVATHKMLRQFELENSSVNLTVDLSSDGRRALGYSDGRVTIHDAMNGKILFTFPKYSRFGVAQVALSDDGTLAVGCDGMTKIQMLDVRSGRRLWTKTSHTNQEVTFSPDSKLLATAYQDNIVLYDARTGRLRRVISVAPGYLGGVLFSTHGRYGVTATEEGFFRLRIQ